MRTNLKLQRIKHNFSQEECAVKLGTSRQTYSAIETGHRGGTLKFWQKVQQVFEVPDADMWGLIHNKN